MTLKKVLLRTSTLAFAGAAAYGGAFLDAPAARAAEVKPLGALDINIGGFSRWYSFFGNLKDKSGGDQHAGTYDFRTDNEIYVYVRGKDEATGLEYGGNVELESDTNTTSNSDEAFVFVRGKFGEFRFGDQNGVNEQMITGAVPLATLSGGIDGVGPIDAGALAYGFTTDDATKVVYYSPVMGGFQLGLSLTPSTDSGGQNIKVTNGGTTDVSDVIEPGISYTNQWGDFGILGAVTGAVGRFSNSADLDGQHRSRDLEHVYGGLDLTYANFKFGGGVGHTKGARPFSTAAGDDGSDNYPYIGAYIPDPGSKQTFYNLGAAATFGPATISVNYGQTVSSHVSEGTPDGSDPEPKYVNVGLEVGVAPGLSVGGEVIYFNNSDNTDNNDGVVGLAGVKLAF
ncbi:porin [Arboricoccus pini]|uniref:Porin n=1 Tax=Arboricoccus pini TaxID=1963835 RepID=A0A212RTE4_9PROT|nr:porin [Arboricoccus pini]SNB75868.1 porin [Arboricoccus pini]